METSSFILFQELQHFSAAESHAAVSICNFAIYRVISSYSLEPKPNAAAASTV